MLLKRTDILYRTRKGGRICILLLIMALGAASDIPAQTESPEPARPSIRMTLAEAINLALRNNRSVESAYLDRVVQKFSLEIAEDKFFPDVTLKGNADWSRVDTTQSGLTGFDSSTETLNSGVSTVVTETVPTGGTFTFTWAYSESDTDIAGDANTDNDTGSWTVAFNQPILKGGGIDVNTASVTQARLSEKGNILSLKSTIMGTVTSVISAFRSFLQAQRQLEINRASLERARDLLETNRLLIEVGRMAAVEIVQTEADVASREFSLETAINNLDSARLNLLRILDIDKHTRVDPVVEGEVEPIRPDYDRCLATALKNRPDHLQSLIGMENARIGLMLAENNQLWDLGFTGSYGKSDARSKGISENDSDAWRMGLNLSVPVYGDLSRKQAILGAKIALKKSEISLKEQEENIAIEVQDAVREVATKLKQVEMAKRARGLSERKLSIEQAKLKVGRSTNFQLVSFQNDLVSAQNSELDAVIAYRNSLTNLDQILGTTLDTWRIDFKTERGNTGH